MDFTNHAQNFGKYVFQSGIGLNVLGTKFQVICRLSFQVPQETKVPSRPGI